MSSSSSSTIWRTGQITTAYKHSQAHTLTESWASGSSLSSSSSRASLSSRASFDDSFRLAACAQWSAVSKHSCAEKYLDRRFFTLRGRHGRDGLDDLPRSVRACSGCPRQARVWRWFSRLLACRRGLTVLGRLLLGGHPANAKEKKLVLGERLARQTDREYPSAPHCSPRDPRPWYGSCRFYTVVCKKNTCIQPSVMSLSRW